MKAILTIASQSFEVEVEHMVIDAKTETRSHNGLSYGYIAATTYDQLTLTGKITLKKEAP